MTRAETVSAGLTGFFATAVVIGYLADLAGLGVRPQAVLLLSLVAAGAFVAAAWRTARREPADLIAWAGVVLFVLAAVTRLSWPDLVPPGRGPDLAHHLLLVDYIEQHGRLVHDRALGGVMGEMAHYTPGAHLLAVLAGVWSGADGFRAFFPLLALSCALAAGFVFLIARRAGAPVPYAMAAVVLLFLPVRYFAGAFTHDSFLAQSIAVLFAVAAWWVLMVWDEHPTSHGGALAAVLLAAVFLCWPIWIGPLALMTAAVAWRRPPRSWLVLAPLAGVALAHAAGRWGWVVIVRADGAVIAPGLDTVGWALPLLAAAGTPFALRDRRARAIVVLLTVILLQALTLFAIAAAQGASTPYLAFKMTYFAIYPAAVLGGLALAVPGRRLGDRDAALGWIVAAVLMVVIARPALAAPRVLPIVSLDLYQAGQWTRTHVGQTCVDYLVGDAETAYWLHLAVFGNPRTGARMAEVDAFEPRAAAGPWLIDRGRDYAIADLRVLPREIAARTEVVRAFGTAAVIRRPGVTMGDCDLRR